MPKQGPSKSTSGSSILEAVDEYVSRSLSAEQFAHVRDFAREVVLSIDHANTKSAANAMRDVSWLAAWCDSVAIPLEVQFVFDPDTITRYIDDGCRDLTDTARRTYRGNLRRIAREVAPWIHPRPDNKYPRWTLKRPYTDAEVDGFLRLMTNQPKEDLRRRLEALLSLGLGAGLKPGEYQHVRPADLTFDYGVLCVGVGSPRRVIPVREPFDARLEVLARSCPDTYLLGDRGGSDRRNAVNNIIRRIQGGGNLPPLTIGALRATWLAAYFKSLGVDALMAAAGVTETHGFTDLARNLPTPDLARIASVLRESK